MGSRGKGPRANQTHNPDEWDVLYEVICQQIKESLDAGDVVRDENGDLVFIERR